jgi:hypothetical protein
VAVLLTKIEIVDDVLDAHAGPLGADFTGYRNHTYRLANLSAVLCPGRADAPETFAIAAAFHDLGIWTDRTFDYLQPSIALATAYLTRTGRASSTPEIAAMILEHHKVRPYRGEPAWLVEPFRRADWIDVTRGLRTFGVPRAFIRELFARWPSAGFHRRLVELSIERVRTGSWNPLPMVRL